MSENRDERLATDYREMLRIQNRPYLSWIAVKGQPPYVEEYLLTVRLRTYALTSQSGKYIVGTTDRCVIKVTLWDSYPHIAPNIKMLGVPPVFHPDWYSKGTYCSSKPWDTDMPLKDYIMRMIGTLTYDPALIDTTSPANYKALEWYLKNRDNKDLFPCDFTELTENTEDEIAEIERASLPFDEIIDSWDIN